jgi:hypothetical protein
MSVGDGHLERRQQMMKARKEILERTKKAPKVKPVKTRVDRHLGKYERVSTLAQQVSLVPGGMKTFMQWVRYAGNYNKEIMAVCDLFFQLPEDRQNAPELEEVCKTLGFYVRDLYKEAVGVAFDLHMSTTRMTAALAMPAVMAKNIKEAKKTDGIEDRRMFMQVTGLMPTPKGSTINIAQTQSQGMLTTDGEPSGIPSFEESVVKFSDIIRAAVETPVALPEPVIDITPEGE